MESITAAELERFSPRITPDRYVYIDSKTKEMNTIGIRSMISVSAPLCPASKTEISALNWNSGISNTRQNAIVMVDINYANRHAFAVPMRISGSPIEFPISALLASAKPEEVMNRIVLMMVQADCAACSSTLKKPAKNTILWKDQPSAHHINKFGSPIE